MSFLKAPKSAPKPFIPNPKPFPSFFVSHGGPTFMYEDDDFGNKGAYRTIRKLGNEIKNKWKPDYIIVVSAHWQSTGKNLIEIASPAKKDGENKLIYDFYGFPNHMYKEEFHTEYDSFVGDKIQQELQSSGFSSHVSDRGIDHGVWVPLKVAFLNYNTKTKAKPEADLPDTSLIQVSLTSNDRDFESNFKLGQVLSKFRENLIWDESKQKYLKGLVIFSGMSVHNLRDLGRSFSQPNNLMPYVKPFQSLLKKTLVNTPKLREDLNNLQTEHKKLLYQAHPTLEHFLPIVAASGLITETKEPIKELYNDDFASLGWGIYQFGNDYKL